MLGGNLLFEETIKSMKHLYNSYQKVQCSFLVYLVVLEVREERECFLRHFQGSPGDPMLLVDLVVRLVL